jgi:hypothetical protein
MKGNCALAEIHGMAVFLRAVDKATNSGEEGMWRWRGREGMGRAWTSAQRIGDAERKLMIVVMLEPKGEARRCWGRLRRRLRRRFATGARDADGFARGRSARRDG